MKKYIRFISEYLVKYLVLIPFIGFIVFIMYLKYDITINSFQLMTDNKATVTKHFIAYFQEDFEHKFEYSDFKQFYEDIRYLIELKQIKINPDISIKQQFENARKLKKYTKYMENFEKGSYFRIIDKLRIRMKDIKTYYLHPLNTTRDIYIKINTENRTINIINKRDFINLSSKSYINFQTLSSNIKINKNEIIKEYNKSLKNLLKTSEILQNEAKNTFSSKFENIIKFYLYLELLIFLIIITSMYLFFKKKEERYNDLKKKEVNLLEKEQYNKTKEIRLNQIEHLMQHDIKTNIDERLNHLSIIYEYLNNNNVSKSVLHTFLSMYTLDLTIKLANDYLRKNKISIPYFSEYLKKENIFKFANRELETYGDIGSKILKDIIIFDIDIDDLNDYPVENIYQNEFSSLLFRLINNAIKHSSNKKIHVFIKKDKNNY